MSTNIDNIITALGDANENHATIQQENIMNAILTIEDAFELATEMYNSLSKSTRDALVEDISGFSKRKICDQEAADENAGPINYVACWILESAGSQVVSETGTGRVLFIKNMAR